MKDLRYKLLSFAEIFDSYRVVPRILVGCYAYLIWDVYQWFKMLPDPSMSQTTLISTVVGAAAVVFGLYTNSGRNWGAVFDNFKSKDKQDDDDDGDDRRPPRDRYYDRHYDRHHDRPSDPYREPPMMPDSYREPEVDPYEEERNARFNPK